MKLRAARRAVGLSMAMACLVGGGTAAPAFAAGSPVPGNVGVRLLPQPGSSDPASVYVTNHIAPGQTVKRQIDVSNTTGATQDISLYAAGASIANDSFTISANDAPSDASSYTTLSPRLLHLRSGTNATVNVLIAVPKDAAPGPQYGVIWAAISSAPNGGSTTRLVNRVGIREYLTIGPGGLPPADFAVKNLTAVMGRHGEPMARAIVTNTGGRTLALAGMLSLTDGPGGTSAGPFTAVLPDQLEPGKSAGVTVTMPTSLPPGPWHAVLTISNHPLVRAVSATLTFSRATPSSGIPCWWWLILAIAIGAVFRALWIVWRRRRDDGGDGGDGAPTAALGRSRT